MTDNRMNSVSNANKSSTGSENVGENKQMVLKEIGQKWSKFSEQDLSAISSKDDLVAQVATKYGLEKAQAQRDVDSLLKGRQF